MQAWYLNSPFLIYLIIITCLDKSKSGAHVNYFFCQFIKWFTIQYYHLLLSPYLYSKVLSKTNQKTEMPEVEDPFISTVSHHSKRKIAYTCCKRSKVSKKAFFTRRKLGRPSSSFFFSNEATKIEKTICFQPQITKWHISKRISYTFASHAPEKARNTWLFTSNYTFYIWKQTLFDFWVSSHTLSVG